MSRKLSRDYLAVDRIFKELNRLLYDKDYDKPELRTALEVLRELRKDLAKKLYDMIIKLGKS